MRGEGWRWTCVSLCYRLDTCAAAAVNQCSSCANTSEAVAAVTHLPAVLHQCTSVTPPSPPPSVPHRILAPLRALRMEGEAGERREGGGDASGLDWEVMNGASGCRGVRDAQSSLLVGLATLRNPPPSSPLLLLPSSFWLADSGVGWGYVV